MGRKVKYKTEKERKEAQLKWQREHYERNKEEIRLQARKRYRLRQQRKIKQEVRSKLYGE
jgi:hypothetical protein|tara:strand:- start:452 stop:631 length:180 start_codon:yes stop_codon:yes gene_type:complete